MADEAVPVRFRSRAQFKAVCINRCRLSFFVTASANCAMRSLRVRHASPYNDTIKNMCVAHFCAILARAAFYGAKRICKMHIGNLGCAGNATTITQSRKCALRIFGRFSRGRRFTAQSEYVKYILGIWGVAGNATTITQSRKCALRIFGRIRFRPYK